MDILIVGSGTVGRATGVGFSIWGEHVRFYDTDPKRLLTLASEGYPTVDSPIEADLYFVAVPTDDVRLIHLHKALEVLAPMAKHRTIVIRSTVPPGTTRRVASQMTETTVLYSPEYLRSADNKRPLGDFLNPRMVLIGEVAPGDGNDLLQMYEGHVKAPVWIVKAEVAELAKLIHNAFNAAKISFMNDSYRLAASLGLDGNLINQIVSLTAEASWNPNYGIVGGKPYAGHCLPKDVAMLLEIAQAHDVDLATVRATQDVNISFDGR